MEPGMKPKKQRTTLIQKSMPNPSVNHTEMGGMKKETKKPRIWGAVYLRIMARAELDREDRYRLRNVSLAM
nr:hypothetical protein CFP56_24567 [Quercus suber]